VRDAATLHGSRKTIRQKQRLEEDLLHRVSEDEPREMSPDFDPELLRRAVSTRASPGALGADWYGRSGFGSRAFRLVGRDADDVRNNGPLLLGAGVEGLALAAGLGVGGAALIAGTPSRERREI
jgi:hypothetical protein